MTMWQNRVQRNVRHKVGKYNKLPDFNLSAWAHLFGVRFCIDRRYWHRFRNRMKKKKKNNATGTYGYTLHPIILILFTVNEFTTNHPWAFIPTHSLSVPRKFNLSINYGPVSDFQVWEKTKATICSKRNEMKKKNNNNQPTKTKMCTRWAFSHIHNVKV